MSARRLDRLRRIALVLPEAAEKETWGEVTFRVRDKMFGITGYDAKRLSVKATLEDQAELVATEPWIAVAPYTGKHGWVQLDLTGTPDWTLVEELLRDSWRLVAPKRLAATLD